VGWPQVAEITLLSDMARRLRGYKRGLGVAEMSATPLCEGGRDPMRMAIVRMAKAMILVFAVVSCATASFAATIYTLNNTIGAGGVTGTIETNGTIGTLVATDITDWNIVIDDGTNTFNLLGPSSGNNSQLFMSAGAAISATSTDLLFDFSGFTGGVLFQNPFIGSSQNWYAFEDQADGIGTGVLGSENLRVGSGTLTSEIRSGVSVIASVEQPIPEPSAALLFGMGFEIAGWHLWKRAA
jgi:hypothetical protein